MIARLVRPLGRWETFLVALLVATIVMGASQSDVFLDSSNLWLAGGTFAERAVMALGLALVVIAAEIDLSIAAVAALAGAVFGVAIEAGVPLWLCVVAALATGVAAGALNGALVVRFGLPSLIVTIGTLALFRGLASLIISDREIASFPDPVIDFGYTPIPGTDIPWSVLVFAVLFAVFAGVLHLTRTGRAIYATGGGREAARFAGVRTDRLRFGLFVVCGLVSAAAGLMLTARLGSVRADNGAGFELEVVAVVVLAGVSIFGGRGNLLGVLLAIFIFTLLGNSLSLADVSGNAQLIVIGSLLILSVLATNAAGAVQRALQARRVRQEPQRARAGA
jgi:rhamnose transport system permease protein